MVVIDLHGRFDPERPRLPGDDPERDRVAPGREVARERRAARAVDGRAQYDLGGAVEFDHRHGLERLEGSRPIGYEERRETSVRPWWDVVDVDR